MNYYFSGEQRYSITVHDLLLGVAIKPSNKQSGCMTKPSTRVLASFLNTNENDLLQSRIDMKDASSTSSSTSAVLSEVKDMFGRDNMIKS